MNLGKKIWVIPDGFLPLKSNGDCVSHEAICVLNTSNSDAHIKITLYFENDEPIDDFLCTCKSKRTNHIRLDKIKSSEGKLIPRGVPYAITVESSENIIVQHSRMDTTQSEMGLMTTIAY